MSTIGLLPTIKREITRMSSRRIYLFGIFLVPLALAFFFISLLDEGLPLKTPVGIVDQDHSEMSRTVTRSLNAEELLDITLKLNSYHEAIAKVREGEIFGFFVIPSDFESDALAGRTPTLEYYSNMTYFVPGTLAFKGFKTVAVGSSAGVVKTILVSAGIDPEGVTAMVQPVTVDTHGIGNPWMNYSYYLAPSFIFGVLQLMIFIMTVYSITTEIKMGTSPGWLATAGGKMRVALIGKLIPYTVMFILVGLLIVAWLFGFRHFPANGSVAVIILGTILMVVACQAFAVLICCALPNPRLAFSIAALIGILTFSFAGFSFPVDKMYGAIAIFSYIVPVRYLFQIYANEALLGAPLYYSRWLLVALVAFIPLPALLARRLKKACLNPVYIP